MQPVQIHEMVLAIVTSIGSRRQTYTGFFFLHLVLFFYLEMHICIQTLLSANFFPECSPFIMWLETNFTPKPSSWAAAIVFCWPENCNIFESAPSDFSDLFKPRNAFWSMLSPWDVKCLCLSLTGLSNDLRKVSGPHQSQSIGENQDAKVCWTETAYSLKNKRTTKKLIAFREAYTH